MVKAERIYFGHPINTYNSELEQSLIIAIERYFSAQEHQIENPNQACHQEGYQRYREQQGNGMQYFTCEVLPQMNVGVFLAFEDGALGSGVWKEAIFLQQQGSTIYEIDREGNIAELDLDESRKLSVEETRLQVRNKCSRENKIDKRLHIL